MKCPKCGYSRTMGDTAPEWQCPSCGIAYAKVQEARDGAARAAKAGGAGKFVLFVVAVIAAGVGYAWLGSPREAARSPAVATPGQASSHTRVVMYSLTTCGFCTAKRQELRANGIPFVEFFLDTDPALMQEFSGRLQAAGVPPGPIGTPTLEVNGVMLPNNPSMDTIRKHL